MSNMLADTVWTIESQLKGRVKLSNGLHREFVRCKCMMSPMKRACCKNPSISSKDRESLAPQISTLRIEGHKPKDHQCSSSE